MPPFFVQNLGHQDVRVSENYQLSYLANLIACPLQVIVSRQSEVVIA